MATPRVLPDPETIRRTAAEILENPEFQIDQDTKLGGTIVDMALLVLEWVLVPFRWLFNAMDGLPDGLRWVVVLGLSALLLFFVGHLLYTLVTTCRPQTQNSKFISALASRRKRSAGDFEQLAQEARTQHDFISAVRFLFRASLVHLQSLEGRAFSPGLTNRQYLRRYQKSPFLESLQSFVDIIDTSWYGNGVCQEAEYLKCRDAYAEIRRQTKGGTHADNT